MGSTFGEGWFDVTYEASAHPFAGTVADALFEEDLVGWAKALQELSLPGVVILGGGRAAELRLEIESQERGDGSHWVVEVTLVRSGDDPWPQLRYLIFDVEPFTERAIAAVDDLLREGGGGS
jgi:hypothetical protein